MANVIGIIGGTGPHGRGLAMRLRESGHQVLLGSRDAGRAGDDEDAIAEAADVVRGVAGLRPLQAGPLRLSAVAEDLTALLISVNRRYRTHASIVLTGVDTGVVGGEG